MQLDAAVSPELGERSGVWPRLAAACLITSAAGWGVYFAVALLARVTPALFPGQELALPAIPIVSTIVETLPDPASFKAPPPEESAFRNPVTILVIGLDRRPQDTDPRAYRADMVAVVSLDPRTKQASMLSFPRDLLITVQRPGERGYQDRINTSFGVGAGSGSGGIGAGARQLVRDMEANFGLRMDYWVVVDFVGVEKLVDAVGGIDLLVPADLDMPGTWYSDDDEHPVWLEIPTGQHHLNGYEAVAFARSREFDDDFHRVRRQQLVVSAALAKALSGGLLRNPLPLWDAYNDAVVTSLSRTKALGLAPLLRDTAGNLRTFSVADPVNGRTTVSDFRTRSGAAVLRWDAANVQYWIDQALPHLAAKPSVSKRDAGDTGFP